jgi:mono/diheme cytochrome c family protein
MKRIASIVRGGVVACAVAVAQGCAGGDTESAADDPVAQGQALYQANCLACHGEGARGDGPMAGSLPVAPPSILEHLAHHTEAQLVQIIQNGLPPAMPPVALSAEEVQLVVDYVWTLVPESEVAGLRAMQEHMEMMGDSGMMNMPGMGGMPGMVGTPASPPPGADSTSASVPGTSQGGQ